MKFIKKNLYIILGLGIAILVSSLGVLDSNLHTGHDFSVHLARIAGVREAIKMGQFPVRIQPGWSNGYGYAISIFYGDIFLYFPAILSFFMSITTAYKIYVIAVNASTVLIAYFCFQQISESKYIGAAGSIIYTLSMYRICNLYIRAAMGEYTAMMFYPLIVLGMWKILRRGKDEKENGWIVLTLGMSGIIQTHVLSCEMMVFFMLLICIISIKSVLQKNTLLQFIKSVVATICLNAWFLIPFLDYSREDFDVFQSTGAYEMKARSLTIYELFAWTTKGAGRVGEDYSNRIPVTLGIAAVFIIILGIVVLVKNTEWKEKEKVNIIGSFFLVVLSAFMTLRIFPWNALEKNDLLCRLVVSLQFPFRFMAVCMVFVSLLACLLFVVCERKINNRKHFMILLFGFCFLSAWQSMEFTDRIMVNSMEYPEEELYTDITNILASTHNKLYHYVGTDQDELYSDKDIKGDVLIEDWERIGNETISNEFKIKCKTEDETSIMLPLAYYPDYQCEDVETGNAYQTYRGANNRLCAVLPENYEGTLWIRFKEPWFWRCSELVSLFSVIALLGIIIKGKWKNRRQV